MGQQVATAIASVLTLWWASPWRPGFHASREEFRGLFAFGAHVVGSDVLNWVSRNADNLLIGVFLGTTALGYYSVAYRILSVTQVVLVNVARKITFPAFSRLQHDPERMARAYYRVTRAAAAVILPGYVGLALVAPELTIVLFGSKWEPSGPVAAVLYLIGPVLTVQAFSGSLLNAANHPDVVFRFRLVTTVANLVGFAIAVQFGIVAVAAAFVVRGYLLAPLILRWVARDAGIPAREYLGQLRGPLLATLVMSAAILLTKLAAGGLRVDLLLLLEAGVGAAAFLAAARMFDPAVLEEAAGVAAQVWPWRRRGERSRGAQVEGP